MVSQSDVTTAIATLKSFQEYEGGSFSAEGLLSLALLFNKASSMVTQSDVSAAIADIRALNQFQPGSYSAEGLLTLALLYLLGTGGGSAGPIIAPASVDSGTSYEIPSDGRAVSVIRLTGNATITLPDPTLETRERYELRVELTQDEDGNNSATFAAPSGFTVTYNGTGSTAPGINLVGGKKTKYLFEYSEESTVIEASQYWFEG